MTTTRREVEDYLAYHGMPHIEDHSNDDDTYARNRIRHQVTPVLEAICPGFAARMTDTTALLRADEEYLTSQGQVLADQAVETGERLTVSAALIGKAPDPVAVRALRLLIGRRSGGDQDCGSAHLTALLRLCRGRTPRRSCTCPMD